MIAAADRGHANVAAYPWRLFGRLVASGRS